MISPVFEQPKNDTLPVFMQKKEQDAASVLFGLLTFYIFTPLLMIWCIVKLVRKVRHRPEPLFQEQKYTLYMLFGFQTLDMLGGMVYTAVVHGGAYTSDVCYAMHTYFSFSFNCQLLTLLFYLYFFHKGIEDPLVNSLNREAIVFVFMLIFSVGFSWDSGTLKCMHLDAVVNRTYTMRNHAALVHAIIFSFLPFIALPMLQYLRLSIKESSTGLIEAAMKLQMRHMNYMILFVSIQVLFQLVMNLVALFVPYERDILIIRILQQLIWGFVYYSVTQYITFRQPRAEQVADEETAEADKV